MMLDLAKSLTTLLDYLPELDWIDWSLQSHAIYGLKRLYIEDHGTLANQVYYEIMGKLARYKVIYSDAPAWESSWLQRLGTFNLRIADIGELIRNDQREGFSNEFTKTFTSDALTQHRADHDALAIALTVRKLLGG